jgi:hypothetical protein
MTTIPANEVEIYPYTLLDTFDGMMLAKYGQLKAVQCDLYAKTTPYPHELRRFECYDYTIGVHGMALKEDQDVPEFLVGKAHHNGMVNFDFCRSDGAYYTAPQREEVFNSQISTWDSRFDGSMNSACSWASGAWGRLINYTLRSMAVVLLVQPEGFVCIDNNLSTGEFMATRLRVLDVLAIGNKADGGYYPRWSLYPNDRYPVSQQLIKSLGDKSNGYALSA